MPDQGFILLAEDDRRDAILMVEAFSLAAIPNPLMVVENGHQAINYLAGHGDFADRRRYPFPALLLLDLKMPWMDGFDVLAWLRRHEEHNRLPVVVLTSLRLEAAGNDQRLRRACDYRLKPSGMTELIRLVKDVKNSWLSEALSPVVMAAANLSTALGTLRSD